jgi:regulatory protein
MPLRSTTLSEALAKTRRYCAIQERCHQEVRDKLYDLGLHREQVEQAIGQLIGEGFLDEQRFAEHYAVSKFRQKGWGRVKIKAALQAKKVSGPCVALGLKAIDPDEYRASLRAAIAKRLPKEKATTERERDLRVVRYFLSRGFEHELISESLSGT